VTTLYNQSQLETPWQITNVNGGAVALGHPYGMSGIRYLGTTLLELGRWRPSCDRRRLHRWWHGYRCLPRTVKS
jgi:acetyl-CoA acetyltransferase